MAAFPPPSNHFNLGYEVELSISCSNLKNRDYLSKSDPAVYLYTSGRELNWVFAGRTEVIDNNLNPKFSTTFNMEYLFEEIQHLKFAVYDVDDKQNMDDVDKQQLLGTMECTMGDIVAAGTNLTKSLKLKDRPSGNITVQVKEASEDFKVVIDFELSAKRLDKKDFFGKSDPYVEIYKVQENGDLTVVYRSQPIKKTLFPKWPAFYIDAMKLCNGDWGRTLQFSVWDWDRVGKNDLIGSCTTTLKDICPEKGGKVTELILTNPSSKHKDKWTGVLVFNSVKTAPRFVDYVIGGCQISLMVAVDFNRSNGKSPDDSHCLHYTGPFGEENEYERALAAVASVLASYDTDQMIAAYGFAGEVPPAFHVSNCFPLSLKDSTPEVRGLQGLLVTYFDAARVVKFSGPTVFTDIVKKAMEYASVEVTQKTQSYTILLIVTNGKIDDLGNTVNTIVAASKLPMSIIIVGVGGGNFQHMESLDADDTPLKDSTGNTMERDVVQFVPFREIMGKAGAKGCIAKETLKEIPRQLVGFMTAKNIKPNPPVVRVVTTSQGESGPVLQHPSQSQDPTPHQSGSQDLTSHQSGPQDPALGPNGLQHPLPHPDVDVHSTDI